MSACFGYDFSRVRVHTDSRVAHAVGARAFVNGQHIWFAPGRGPADRALLEHEVAHVVQQATGDADLLRGAGEARAHRDWLERRASARGVRRPSMISRVAQPLPTLRHPAVIQFNFEEDTLRELHRMPSAEVEGISEPERKRRIQALAARGGRLFALFSALTGREADEIYERLRERRKGDVLSERFYDMLSTALRKDLLASIGLRHRRRTQIVPDPGEFCQPFSKREIDQDLDFEIANEMDHFVNEDLRDLFGDEAADLYDAYLTSTAKNATPRIFKDPGSELVQSFVNHETTAKRQRELAGIIENKLPNICETIPPNRWVDFSLIFAGAISPNELTAPLSFGGFSIPGVTAGGVSPAPGAPESRTLSMKQGLLRRAEVGGVTTGVRLSVQFHFVVKDSIDFCPGNIGGFIASHRTIPLSRLEASGMAFPVPFEVHYDGPVLEVELGPAAIRACS